MESDMAPLQEIEAFRELMVKFSNPVLGILVGAVLTAIIQSSSASVGIIQALAASGAVTLPGVIFILFGQNIGTCATAMLASIGTNRAGKRAALMHLMFNVIGTLLFIPICLLLHYPEFIMRLTDSPEMQISFAHIGFNVVTTIVMLPFAQLLVKLSKKLIPGKDSEYEEMRLQYLDERILGTPSIAVAQVLKEVERMAHIARNNFELAMKTFFKPDKEAMGLIKQNEQVLNFLNHNITAYLVKIHALDLTETDSRVVGSLFHVVNDLERVGDHAENILEYTEHLGGGAPPFSEMALQELRDMGERVLRIIDESIGYFLERHPDKALADGIAAEEEEIDDLVLELRNHHVERLNSLECTPATGMVYIDLLTDLERVSDHATNIMYAAHDSDGA